MAKIYKKVWVVIYKETKDGLRYLALKPTPGPEYPYDYYVVTGDVENGETFEQAAVREVQEETGLEAKQLQDLNDTFDYEYKKRLFHEPCYAALVKNTDIVLNEEHIGYKWMAKKEFITCIWQEINKEKLKAIIDRIEP